MNGTRWALFGGSFDPPHLAHALACLWALETGEVDRVLIVPVAQHAFDKRLGASFDHRLAMCRLAVTRLGDAVVVSDIEVRSGQKNYTIDTLRTLEKEFPGDTFRLLVGSDVVKELPLWRESAEVLRRAPLLELPRPSAEGCFADAPGALPHISSTLVRDALRTGADASRLLAFSVRAYIARHGLYGPTTPTQGLSS